MDLGPIPPQLAPTAETSATVYVEGGSGPQPQHIRPDVDPEIAQMDAVVTGRDIFGRCTRRRRPVTHANLPYRPKSGDPEVIEEILERKSCAPLRIP